MKYSNINFYHSYLLNPILSFLPIRIVFVCCSLWRRLVEKLKKIKLVTAVINLGSRVGEVISVWKDSLLTAEPIPLNPVAAWTRAVLMYPAQVCSPCAAIQDDIDRLRLARVSNFPLSSKVVDEILVGKFHNIGSNLGCIQTAKRISLLFLSWKFWIRWWDFKDNSSSRSAILMY